MRFLKKFEGYSDELFWEISVEEAGKSTKLELDKYLIKIIEILDSLKVKYELKYFTIEGNFMTDHRLVKDKNQRKLKNLRVVISAVYAIDIQSIDDEYFIVSLQQKTVEDAFKNQHSCRLNKYYKADDLCGLEECLKYLIKKV
jgi:hypothetical protein